MATIQSQVPDRTSEEQPAVTDQKTMKEQSTSIKKEMSATSQHPAAIVNPTKPAPESGSFGSAGDFTGYLPTIFSPQAQSFYYRGYENPGGEWDEYFPYLNAEGLEIPSPGGYSENPSLIFHTGYGYNSQIPYGPYSPAASPLPTSGDAQLYSSPQHYPLSGQPPYFQQLVPPGTPYMTSTAPVSQPASFAGVDQQGDNMPTGTSASYHHPPPVGSFGGGGYHGIPSNLGFHDWHQGFDGGIWSDWSKPSDRQRPMTPISPAVSPQPIGSLGSYGYNVAMGSQQHGSFYGHGSRSSSYDRVYMHNGGHNQGTGFGNAYHSSFSMGSQGWVNFDGSQGRGRGGGPSYRGNGAPDILNEQNRGPRASKPKTQVADELNSSADAKKQNKIGSKNEEDSYEKPEFVTDYKDAKFFVIKSYSEDNVHKSIKYNVWASTPNGNKKLDAAYHEAKEKQEPCPVFLLFSVNASAQFCGVAEMVGPVNFEKNVDYWQQDKWNGQFPVKWHIIKDVPNSQFRHIILENNDNKPVTNSRDTQEVMLEQGIEMLNIFKNCEADTSILDDFDFYEEREKVILERKAKRQASLASAGMVGENEHKLSVAIPTSFIKQMSKSFAQVVRLDEGGKDVDKASASPDAVITALSPAQA